MNHKTVVILGAGVTGLSTAYHLARKGFTKVIVLDKGPAGDGSSSRAAGIITGLLWTETGVRARQISLQLFRDLSEELEGYRFQSVGALNLFEPQSWKERKKLLPLYDRCQAPYEILDAKEMRARWPDLYPREDFIGLFDPRGGYSEPQDYIPALAQKCRQLGVEIREHQLVTDFSLQGERITGVRTVLETIEADAVVSTIYSWTNMLLSRLGLQLPVKTVVHQRYITEPLLNPLAIPAVNADPMGGYVRPAAGGRLLFGIETAEREEQRVTRLEYHLSELEQYPDPRYAPDRLKEEIRTGFSSFVPALGTVKWESDKVGLLTFSMDGEPILGPVHDIPGLYVGLAFHSGGFAYNPVSGLLLAEFVADSHTSVNVMAFSPDRFNAAETAAYLAETVKQKDVARRRH